LFIILPNILGNQWYTPAKNPYNAEILQENDTWGFSQNAGHADQMGGFIIRIDGMRAFVAPCDPVIPTPNPCS
jgi:hypothetical protein